MCADLIFMGHKPEDLLCCGFAKCNGYVVQKPYKLLCADMRMLFLRCNFTIYHRKTLLCIFKTDARLLFYTQNNTTEDEV